MMNWTKMALLAVRLLCWLIGIAAQDKKYMIVQGSQERRNARPWVARRPAGKDRAMHPGMESLPEAKGVFHQSCRHGGTVNMTCWFRTDWSA